MKIITLIENLAYKQGLVAEHGLAIFIESENRKILFDTGQSGLFLQNAAILGINIEDIDILILSHGHYDHTGGLYPFLKKNFKAKVYAKNGIFTPKYHGADRFIGVEKNEALLKDRFIPLNSITEIVENIFIMPEIPIYNRIDTHFKGLTIKNNENELISDEFSDELFLVIKQNNKINIITACSHRGITNICKAAVDYFKLPVNLLLGGFHMKESTQTQYTEISSFLKQLKPQHIGVCHCTGIDKYAELRNDCGTNVFYNFTASEIEV
jgi:7,8-dihydropterin-6-yl-methyl-4-(beta-D-ribofuranosyl)aminobenzene 5'-phosphate synthase